MITAELFNAGPMGAYQDPNSYPDYENGYTYTFTNEWYVNSLDEDAPIYTTE
jgi:hypothetical protein